MKIKGFIAGGFALTAALLIGGCGSNAASAFQPTQSQALEIASDLLGAISGATVNSGGTVVTLQAPGVAAHVRTAQLGASAEAVAASAGQALTRLAQPRGSSINVTIAPVTFTCPAGGTITVSGSASDTDNSTLNYPNIVLSENILEVINKCGDGSFVLNGNPSVTLTGTSSLVGTIFTENTVISGGVTANGTSCPINVTINGTVNTSTDVTTGSVSGSVCGVSISGTF